MPAGLELVPIRFLPKQDLKKSCFLFLQERIRQRPESPHLAAVVVSAVGSLSRAHLRMAGAKGATELEGPFEILSLSGTLSVDGVHLHISISDHDGRVFGGHLLDGALIHTTAEITIALLDDHEFHRSLDPATGYKELVIKKV